MGAADPRHIYDRLLDLLPGDATVDACLVGQGWTLVQSEGYGLALTFREGARESALSLPLAGRPLHELARHIKSWNSYDACIGLAALNSCLNSPSRIEAWMGCSAHAAASRTVFSELADRVTGAKVAVVGHFPDLQALSHSCTLTVLERRPQPGDLPDPACEYVLPEQDFVLITGTAFTNKTLPRLLELSRQAYVVLVGPSVPLTPLWFDFGVDLLAGAVVVDPQAVWRAVAEGAHREVFEHGALMVQISREEWRP